MSFILDRCIQLTFLNSAGEGHALYDYICYEYLLGRNFSEATFRNFHKGVRPMDELEKRWTTPEAMNLMSKLIHRWCFPTRIFLVRILMTLSQTVKLFTDLAENDIQNLGNKSCYYQTLWDSKDSQHAQIYADLFKVISTDYIRKDAESGFADFQGFHKWFGHHIKEKLSWKQEPELLDKALVLQHFGWQQNGQMVGESTCHVLLRFIRDFVNRSHRYKVPNADNGKFAQHVRDLAVQHGSRGQADPQDSFHLVLGELWETSWGKYQTLHQIGYSTRLKPDKDMCHAWEADGTTVELVNEANKGLFSQMNNLVQGLYLSGYQAQAFYTALARWEHYATKHRIRDQGDTKGPSLARWLNVVTTPPDFLGKESDGSMTYTGFGDRHTPVPDKNWQHIREEAINSISVQTDRARIQQSTRDRIERTLVVDDSTPQPKGLTVSKGQLKTVVIGATKEEQEDPGEDTTLSSIPIIVGGFALLFFLNRY